MIRELFEKVEYAEYARDSNGKVNYWVKKETYLFILLVKVFLQVFLGD